MRRTPLLTTFCALSAALIVGLTATLSGGSASAAPTVAAKKLTVNKSYRMPSTGSVKLVGHGFGHGHGMSQYGAEGAAREGLSWKQILGFYYPGTSLSTAKGRISVLISANTTRYTVVQARSHLRVKRPSTREAWTLPDRGATKWRLAVSSKGESRVEYYRDKWRIWRTIPGTLEFHAGGAAIRLYVGNTSVRYRGTLRSAIPKPGTRERQTVNLVDVNHYTQGVVAREMPATWSPNAVRAQSVAARTYGVRQKATPLTRTYHICDTTACQVYGGVEAEHSASNAAVQATKSQVLTSGGKPAFTQFSSSSGGWTADSSKFSYLPAKQDPYDGWAGNPVHEWRLDLDVAKVEKAWPTIGNLETIKIRDRDGNGEWGGRVNTLTMFGSQGSRTIYATEFRSKLGLRSTWFDFAS
ncbi:SpoIID/LytB domain protein [Nocardioides daedukensis]|uniref:SpoIID/LytB domain protein n=1 Tax=Nocardioides daedukensis TaxID=634462 RepID=A0A7Y9S2T8_9ACTN|nr:SpoIID/LytB domain-containing protein [Nocardioides daedukensis]NYG60286.1 SpoIID/LytB domain protein [Nocardioides daedukensis]